MTQQGKTLMVLKSAFQHGVINVILDAVLLEWKNKVMELVNNRITTLKVQNNYNHPTDTFSFKTTFLKHSSTCT